MKMKIFFIIIITMFVISLIAEESVGITLKVKGNVILTHEEEDLKAKDGAELENNDVLESKDESFAVVKFIDGSSVVKLFPNSVLTINAEKKDGKLNKRSNLKLGNLWAKVSKNTGEFVIDTPTTVISVKGTKFVLLVAENGSTNLYTLEGAVNIKNKKDGNEANVGKGQKASTSGEGEIIVSTIIEGEMDEYDISSSEILNINLKNENGEKRSIEIEFE
ncbi:MAG: FecR family protein [Candidatus Tenebribacter mawsonii]|nr:FecR family protein [Candidatus Tenebribacter mawsonii]